MVMLRKRTPGSFSLQGDAQQQECPAGGSSLEGDAQLNCRCRALGCEQGLLARPFRGCLLVSASVLQGSSRGPFSSSCEG